MGKEDLLETWRERLEDFAQSEMTVQDWCDFNRVPQHQYYYWRRKLLDILDIAAQTATPPSASAPSATTTAWMPVAILEEPHSQDASCAITLRVALGIPGASIDIRPGFHPDLLRAVVHALNTPSC